MKSDLEEGLKPNRTVIIIGGGMAAIKCAHTLSKKGIWFHMLEYSNILGGRLKSINFQGRLVEEGANWVTGT